MPSMPPVNRFWGQFLAPFFAPFLAPLFAVMGLLSLSGCATPAQPADSVQLRVGAEQPDRYLPLLEGKRVGLVVNPSSRVGEQHLVDYLRAEGVEIGTIFALEHGFRGTHDAGVTVDSGQDAATGLPIHSLYGKNKKPGPKALAGLDLILFDIQDVGVRFYTYVSSLHYVMEGAAEVGLPVLVLDRPNPNGFAVDGPVLEPEYQSFVGMHQVPVLHGMTLGEMGRMINGEGWLANGIEADLTVVPLAGYHRALPYPLPVKPSPNLPNAQSVQLYPSLCFFEATPISIGRGTPFPFQVIGHDKLGFGDFQFTPVSTPGAALNPKLQDRLLTGQDLRHSPIRGLNLAPLLAWQARFAEADEPLFDRPDFMDKLAGGPELRQQIEAGLSETEIRASWAADLAAFRKLRKPYLLYPDTP